MTDTPIRIQRKRTKGWRLPPNTVCINRPSKFGNPFRWQDLMELNRELSKGEARAICVQYFYEWLDGDNSQWQGASSEQARDLILKNLHELKDKNIACYCPTAAVCHGDPLRRIANAYTP